MLYQDRQTETGVIRNIIPQPELGGYLFDFTDESGEDIKIFARQQWGYILVDTNAARLRLQKTNVPGAAWEAWYIEPMSTVPNVLRRPSAGEADHSGQAN